jgi:hypothetical protein
MYESKQIFKLKNRGVQKMYININFLSCVRNSSGYLPHKQSVLSCEFQRSVQYCASRSEQKSCLHLYTIYSHEYKILYKLRCFWSGRSKDVAGQSHLTCQYFVTMRFCAIYISEITLITIPPNLKQILKVVSNVIRCLKNQLKM